MTEEPGLQERILSKAKEYVVSLDSAEIAEIEVEIEAAFLAGRKFGDDLLKEKTKEWLHNVHTKGDFLSIFLTRCDRKNLESSVDNLLGWRPDLKEAIALLKILNEEFGDKYSESIKRRIDFFLEKHEPETKPPF